MCEETLILLSTCTMWSNPKIHPNFIDWFYCA